MQRVIHQITPNQLTELKALSKPPEAVKVVCITLNQLLGGKNEWVSFQKQASQPKLLVIKL